MSRRDRNYWIEQAKDKILAQEKEADSAASELIFLYDEAANQIENEIGAMFSKYAADNQLSSAKASKLLSGKEFSVWKKSIAEYVREASAQGQGSKTLVELNTLAMKSRISRKEQLLGNIYKEMAKLAGDSTMKLEELLRGTIKINYLRSNYDLQRGLGLGWNVSKLDSKLIEQTIGHPWSQKQFSRTVWDDVDRVTALAKREVTLGFIKGSNPKEIARNIDDVMGKGRYAAERLARTECKYFAHQGEIAAFRENGIKRYKFIGSPENGSCGCANLNGDVFSIKEAEAGINLPPIHPNCLCTIIADFEISLFDNKRNAAPLSENVKFREWKKKYADQVDTEQNRGIMKEIKIRNIPITDQAISRMPDVRPKTLSRKQAKIFSRRQRELLKFVQSAPVGKEAVCYCDMSMNVLTQYIGGGENRVNPTKMEIPHVCMHNHPSGTTFTFNDIFQLFSNNKMKILSAVGNNGNIFVLEKQSAFDPKVALSQLRAFQKQQSDMIDSPEKYLAAVEQYLKEAEKNGIRYTKYSPTK